MVKKLAIMVFMLVASSSLLAAQSPVALLQQISNEMISQLQQHKAEIKQQPSYVYQLAKQVLLPHVDADAMAKLALGRDNWLQATPSQRQQFTQAFTTLMIRTYGAALAAYDDETIKFNPLRGDISQQQRVQVDSVILQKDGPSIPVSYKLFLSNDDWKVYDIIVDGVSMVQSFRSQFSSEIARGGISGLLAAMSKHSSSTANE